MTMLYDMLNMILFITNNILVVMLGVDLSKTLDPVGNNFWHYE